MSSAVEKHILFAGCFSPFTPPQPSCSVNRLLFLLFDAEEMTDNAFAEQRTKALFSHSTVYMYQGIVTREGLLFKGGIFFFFCFIWHYCT